jgi:DNA-binding LacI/PurR family transcriptional regulator
MPSVRKIAERAGVSITTVSRVLNNDPAVSPDTRDRVLSIANRVRYIPTVGRRVTTNIGFAYTQDMTIAHPFDAAVLGGAVRGLDECRFDLVVLDIQRDRMPNETLTQFFMRKGVRGVILRTTAASRDICHAIADSGFPHVVISERFDSPNVNWIDGDSRPETIRAIKYLIALGHDRIAFAMHNVPDRDHLDRLEGYKEALANHGLPFDERLVFRHPISLGAGGTVMKMIASMAERPSAVFFADPLLAVGCIKKAHELGVRIPADMSVVGFDDTDVRFGVHPTLTAVCQGATELGYEAARWLARAVTSPSKSSFKKTIPTFFEVNQSTGPPPGAARPAVVADTRGASANDRTAGVVDAGHTLRDREGDAS